MADVTPTGGQDRRRSTLRTRKRPARIDMTAMVDVAFLLLTFFVLTAVMSDGQLMEVFSPPKCEGEDCYKKIDHRKILTLILDENDQVQYYVGIEEPEVKTTDYDENGMRKIVGEFIYGGSASLGKPLCATVNNEGLGEGRCWDPIIVLKAKNKSRYGNLVDALDELSILKTPKFTIAPFTVNDSLLLAQASK
ncbi:MAG: biopolymer transporter ExbD [Bacteroidota bacterium]